MMETVENRTDETRPINAGLLHHRKAFQAKAASVVMAACTGHVSYMDKLDLCEAAMRADSVGFVGYVGAALRFLDRSKLDVRHAGNELHAFLQSVLPQDPPKEKEAPARVATPDPKPLEKTVEPAEPSGPVRAFDWQDRADLQ